MGEIHVQTPEMAGKMNPGVMLNLEHSNMTQANESGVDDSKLDWRRIPSTDGTCVCVPNPAGLPYFEGAYDNATYKGRVKFVPPWQHTGSYGPPTGKAVVADHYVKWTFLAIGASMLPQIPIAPLMCSPRHRVLLFECQVFCCVLLLCLASGVDKQGCEM